MTDDAEDAAELADVRVTVEGELTAEELEYARGRIASLARYSRSPPENARQTLRPGGASRKARTFYVADASLIVDGRVLAAHATGPTPNAATDEVHDRLRRQMRRVVGAEVARRNEPAVIEKALSEFGLELHHRPAVGLKPPEQREVVAVRTVPDEPESTLGVVAELFDRDYEFNLFRHARTGEDAVVDRREDERVGLIHPPGSSLADESEIVVPEPGRYPEPVALTAARSELDVLNQRFLYFIDVDGGRGKVLYLRHDGDYGLVELA